MELLIFAKEYWAIITAITGIIISHTRMESAIKSLKQTDDKQARDIEKALDLHNRDISYLNSELKSNSLEFKKIEIAIKGIETTLEFIKEQLKR